MKKQNFGTFFDEFLYEEGFYEEVTAAAIARVLARQTSLELSVKPPQGLSLSFKRK